MRSRSPDILFLALAAGWLLLGLVVLTTASGPVSYSKYQDSFYLIRHQILFGVLPGLVLATACYLFDYRFWKRLATPLMVVAVVLLASVFVPGIGADWGTAHSWINVFGFSLQPAEFAKIALVIWLAWWFDERGDASTWQGGLIPFLVAFGIVAGLLVAQPDTGSLLVVAAAAITVFFLAGARWSHIGALAGIGALGLWTVIKMSAYRAQRLMTFLNPEKDPQGVGYHINQAYLAIGSGGWLGLGLGNSRQRNLYLPETVNDSIFAIMGEEFGFVLCVAFIVAVGAFFWRGLTVVQSAPDRFGRLLGGGLLGWLFFQTVANIGSMVGIMPITGLPLPFVSYGGTAMMAAMAAIGIILNISVSGPEGRLSRLTRH